MWFLLLSAVCAAGETADFNLTVPKFIPSNTRFEVSLVTTNIDDEADSLSIIVNTSDRLELNSVLLKLSGTDYNLSFTENGAGENIYSFGVNLKELKILSGNFFQLIMQLKPENILSGKISIQGIFFNNGEEKGRLENAGETPSAYVNFYKVNKTAGKCLALKQGEQFNVTNDHSVKKLVTEFWGKFNSSNDTFLEVVNASADKFRMQINSSQVLQIDSDSPVVESVPVFLSYRTWNHFAVILIPSDEKILFFCNDVLTGSYKVKSNGSAKLQFNFKNDSSNPYYLDLFRFISVKGEDIIDFNDRNYLSFISDGSSLLEQYTFDDQPGLRDNDETTSLASLELVKSDAPIFPRAPELNVNIASKSMLLEWTGGDYKQAEQYVVERSSGSSYRQLGTVIPDNNIEKNYNYIDPKNEKDEIVYYRIKQINKDGSSVYSMEIKIGQGFVEPFTIEQNFPNPFNPKTSIEIELLVDTEVDLVIYNLDGSEIARLYKGFLNKGVHKFTFNGEGLPSGIYLYKISTPGYSQTRKMILAK